jgi:uncharacterized protein
VPNDFSRNSPDAGTLADDPATVGPIPLAARAPSIDGLRGVAVLGILLMNIIIFGLPEAADDNPTWAGQPGWLDVPFWFVNQVLFEGKMRAIFSMLFGAGVIILTSRVEKRDPAAAADIYYRRTLWLAGLGILHTLFLWDGDILFTYGIAGLILYPFRRFSPPALLAVGALVLALIPLKAALEYQEIESLRTEAAAAEADEKAGKELTAEQQEAKEKWDNKQKEFKRTKAETDKEIAEHRAGYWRLFERRLRESTASQASGLSESDLFLDAAGMMFLGMALVKLGIFSALRSPRFYAVLAMLGYGIGIPLNTYVAARTIAAGFEPLDTYLLRHVPYDAGRLLVALGHIGLFMLLWKGNYLPRLMGRLAFVGRMALSNYLLQSLICTLIFDGYGLGMFARLSRASLLLVVFGVWAVELLLSPIWLRFFRFGPLEWAWRSLTYWRRQPMLQTAESDAA